MKLFSELQDNSQLNLYQRLDLEKWKIKFYQQLQDL